MPDQVRDKRKTHFFQVYNAVLDKFDLTVGAFWLYFTLCRFAGRTDECFPSVSTLASRARCGPQKQGVSLQCIRNWMDELTSKKLVTIIEKSGVGRVYEIEDVTISTPQPEFSAEVVTTQPGLKKPADYPYMFKNTRESAPPENSIDIVQNTLPFLEKTWRENTSTRKLPWKKFNYPREVEELEDRATRSEFRAAWVKYIQTPNPDQFQFLRDMREAYPRPTTTRSNGHGKPPAKSVDDMWRERHPELYPEAAK